MIVIKTNLTLFIIHVYMKVSKGMQYFLKFDFTDFYREITLGY